MLNLIAQNDNAAPGGDEQIPPQEVPGPNQTPQPIPEKAPETAPATFPETAEAAGAPASP